MTEQAKALSSKDNGTDDWPIGEDMLRIIQQMGEREREAVDWPARTVLRLLATIEERDKRIAEIERWKEHWFEAAKRNAERIAAVQEALDFKVFEIHDEGGRAYRDLLHADHVRRALKGKHDADC